MNGSWRSVWPKCLHKNNVPNNVIPTVCQEMANLAGENNIEGMEIEDTNEMWSLQEYVELTDEMWLTFSTEYALDDETSYFGFPLTR